MSCSQSKMFFSALLIIHNKPVVSPLTSANELDKHTSVANVPEVGLTSMFYCVPQGILTVQTKWRRSWRSSLWRTRARPRRRMTRPGKRRKGKRRKKNRRKRRNETKNLLYQIFDLSFSSFSTIDSKETEFGHLHIDLFCFSFYDLFAWRSQDLGAAQKNDNKKCCIKMCPSPLTPSHLSWKFNCHL